MLFEWFKRILFENGQRYAKSDTRYRKASRRGFKMIQNHIIQVQFERKIMLANQICFVVPIIWSTYMYKIT